MFHNSSSGSGDRSGRHLESKSFLHYFRFVDASARAEQESRSKVFSHLLKAIILLLLEDAVVHVSRGQKLRLTP